VEFTVRLSGATIKALEAALRQGHRAADVRVIRRVQALLEMGAVRPVGVVADRLGLDATTVYGWLHAFLVDGVATLRYGRPPDRPSKLAPSQKRRLCALIEAGPLAAGYPPGCWSMLFLQDLIQREFGQFYNHPYLATLLRDLGFSYQMMVYQLPGYSPDYHPVEHVWKNLKKRFTHLRYRALLDGVAQSLYHQLVA
jgi:transposase